MIIFVKITKRLIYFLIVFFFNFSINNDYILLKKDETTSNTSRYAYIDISEFSFFKKIYINAKVKNGYFLGHYLYFLKSDDKPINNKIYHYSYSVKSEDSVSVEGKNNIYSILNFYLTRDDSQKYYYLYFPLYEGECIEILCSDGGTSIDILWIVFGVILFVLVVLIILTIFFYFRRKSFKQPIDRISKL